MINIRQYQKADWNRLCEIHDKARMDELEGSVDLAAFLSLEKTAENEGLFEGELFVACYAETMVGFVAFNSNEITWLYVDPVHYTKGIGKSLLNFAIDNAGDKITAEVLSGNKPAIKLYLNLGFEIIEKRKGKLEGNEKYEAEGLIFQLIKD